ncbi:MAG TPA: FGGY family carbohydrate kinase [Candidatus Dormibacteraeota bacterium]|jgi:xylulokinase|nr:FGGY family carbohydrate kinase [Candidatus Dormibacteraeota bacterium]
MTAGDLILALDVGTSRTKALGIDLDGRVEAEAEIETPVSYPSPGYAESQPQDWWRAASRSVRHLIRGRGMAPERVRVVALCGFMHTLVALDAGGRPLHPAMLWSDQRSAPQTEALASVSGAVAKVTGQPLSTMSSLPRLLWLRQNRPDVLEAARSFLLVKDFVRFRLTGERATDARDARGSGLVDAATGSWSAELLSMVGIPVECMPPILRADEICGAVSARAARETGLRPGTPVVVGTGDWFATLVGSGCFLPERACLYLGSAGLLGAFTSAAELGRLGSIRNLASVTSTGTALSWLRRLLYSGPAGPGYDRVFAAAETSRPGARELLFLPHLMGERGGGMRPDARGAFFGLTLAHGRGDLARAVLEGTVLWLRAVSQPALASVPFGDVLLTGGGARSGLWRRICAATFARRVLLPASGEAAALGAAMLGATAIGVGGGYQALARAWSSPVGVEEPDPDLVEAYAAVYRRFVEVEAALRPLG